MKRLSIIAAVVLSLAACAVASYAQGDPLEGGKRPVGKKRIVAGKPPMSIFNDQVRRFRFLLEDTLVTAETAEIFNHRYQNGTVDGGNPQIIGGYADPKTNSLVVVGPPEAEHAIRLTLATWLVERKATYNPSLKVEKNILENRRKELLRNMGQVEVLLVGIEKEKAEQLKSRLLAFENELKVVEGKIEVLVRYIKRINNLDTENE